MVGLSRKLLRLKKPAAPISSNSNVKMDLKSINLKGIKHKKSSYLDKNFSGQWLYVGQKPL